METEGYRPNIEILHIGSFDVLINNKQESISQNEFDELKLIVTKDLSDNSGEKPLKGWRQGDDYRIRVDSRVTPRFAIKEKWIRPKSYDFGASERELRATGKESDLEVRKMLYASASVMNEMTLAKDIRSIVSSEEIQTVFMRSGVQAIDYIEPLMGIIDKNTGDKFIIYKFANGDKLVDSFLTDADRNKIVRATRRLEVVISDKNIIPHDLQTRQFLIEKDENGGVLLHLVDIDLFTRR